jgi:hypothetical protein
VTDIKIIASPDFEEQTAEVAPLLESLMLGIRPKGGAESEKLDLKENLESVTVQSEDEVRSLLGATGWGLLGSSCSAPPASSSAPCGAGESRRRSASPAI